MKKYGHIISKLRKKQGLTQEQLGKKLNVSYQAISKWENNLSEPDLETIEKLTEVFGISMFDFFNMAKNPENINNNSTIKEENNIKESKNFIKTKPWYLVAGLGVLIVILSLCAFLIPVKYSSSKIYEMVDPSVFCITAEGPSTKQAGSGFFINDTGLAVTNYHVIQNCTSGKIQLNNGKTYDVKSIVGCDENKDIAITQIDIKKSKGVKLGNSNKIEVGEIVYAIGYPESFQLGSVDSTFTQGIISKTSYNYEGNTYIQTTVDMTRGNSGGVLVNQQGQVIGITTLMITNGLVDYMNMAIPINKINDVKKNINVSLSKYYDETHKTFCFYSDGVIIGRQNFMSGKKITPIADPIKDGYTFDGWYTSLDYETKFNFDNPITNQIQCFAKWVANSYIVTYSAIDAVGEMEQQNFVYDQAQNLLANVFTKEYLEFDYWICKNNNLRYYDQQEVSNLSVNNGEVVELVAVFKDLEYEIKFDASSGQGVMSNYITSCNKNDSLPKIGFTKVGYIFDGWEYGDKKFDDQDDIFNLTSTLKEILFVATWRPIDYIICFKSSNFSINFDATYDQDFELIDLSIDYKHFIPSTEKLKAWKIDGKEYQVGYVVRNLTIFEGTKVNVEAVWEDIEYIIEFISEETNSVDRKTVKYSEICNFTTSLTYDGYYISKFMNLSTGYSYNHKATFSKLSSTDGDIIKFKIEWLEIEYTIKYLVNDVEYGLYNLKYFSSHEIIDCTMETPGYNFGGWQNKENIYNPKESVSELATSNGEIIEFKAKLIPIKYTVKFNPNGGSHGSQKIVEYGTWLKIEMYNNPTKGNTSFIGWGYKDHYLPTNTASILCKHTTIENDVIEYQAIWENDFSGGDGSEENPYLISKPSDLQSLSMSLTSIFDSSPFIYYKLTNDIDMAGAGIYYKYRGRFSGVLDGNGYNVKNIALNGPLFYEISSSSIIKNLTLENLTCKRIDTGFSSGYVSFAVVTYDNYGTLENVHINNLNFSYEWDKGISVAGLCENSSGMIKNCSVKNVCGFAMTYPRSFLRMAGLANQNTGTISNSYASDMTLSFSDVGYDGEYSYDIYPGLLISGFVSVNTGTIEYCYSDVDIVVNIGNRMSEANNYLAGFVGDTRTGSVLNCFSLGDVTVNCLATYYKAIIYCSKFAYFEEDDEQKKNLFVSADIEYNISSSKTPYENKSYIEVESDKFKDEVWLKENIFDGDNSMWVFKQNCLPTLISEE